MLALLFIAVLLGFSNLVCSIPTCAECEKWTTRADSTPTYLITNFDMACTSEGLLKCNSEAPYSMTINYTPPDSGNDEQGPAVHGASCTGLTGLTMDYTACEAPYSWVTTAVEDTGLLKVRMEFGANGHPWDGEGSYSMKATTDSFEIVPDFSRNCVSF